MIAKELVVFDLVNKFFQQLWLFHMVNMLLYKVFKQSILLPLLWIATLPEWGGDPWRQKRSSGEIALSCTSQVPWWWTSLKGSPANAVCCITQRQHSKCQQNLAEFPIHLTYCNLCSAIPFPLPSAMLSKSIQSSQCMCLAVL
jgi:hypothetical protein